MAAATVRRFETSRTTRCGHLLLSLGRGGQNRLPSTNLRANGFMGSVAFPPSGDGSLLILPGFPDSHPQLLLVRLRQSSKRGGGGQQLLTGKPASRRSSTVKTRAAALLLWRGNETQIYCFLHLTGAPMSPGAAALTELGRLKAGEITLLGKSAKISETSALNRTP